MWLRFCCLALSLCLLPGTPQARAQAASDPTFDELSRRAAAAVDAKPEEAVTLYQQALKLRPSWAEGWLYEGASLYQLNRFDEAREAFQHGVQLAGENGSALAFLGLCEYELGDYRQALEHMESGEALGLGDNPQFTSAVVSHAALLLVRSSEFEQASELLQPLARAGDQSPLVIQAYGLSALRMAKLPSEVPAGKQPLVTLAGRAAWAFFAQRPEDASTLFQQLLAQYPNEPCVHYDYGIFLLERDPEASLAEFQKELQLNPGHIFAHLQIALLEIKNGNPESAVQHARAALKIEPRNAVCHLTAGRALLGAGQIENALKELQTAARAAPRNPQTHFYLELAYRRAGRTEDANREKELFTRLKAARDPLSLPAN